MKKNMCMYKYVHNSIIPTNKIAIKNGHFFVNRRLDK